MTDQQTRSDALLNELERIERRWSGSYAPDAVIRRIDQIVEELAQLRQMESAA
jgi:hypothetical protein